MAGLVEVVALFLVLLSLAGLFAYLLRPKAPKPKQVSTGGGGLFSFVKGPLHSVNSFLFG